MFFSGLLTDRVKKDESIPGGTRISALKDAPGVFGLQPLLNNDNFWNLMDQLGEVAKEHGTIKWVQEPLLKLVS